MRRAATVVGRDAELGTLRAALQAAGAGGRSSTFLVGDPGIGKTRLLSETAAAAKRLGVPVLQGRAGVAAPAAFGVVAEALRSWLRAHTPAPNNEGPFGAGLRLILPEWPAGHDATAPLSDNQLRLLAYEGVVRLVRDIATTAGAVLVFDDLHWADADSLEVIRYIATAEIEGTLLLGALRTHEGALAHEMIDALERANAAEVLTLEQLQRDGVAELVAEVVGGRAPDVLVDDVMTRTRGVPLFVEEVLDAHIRNGSVYSDDAGSVHWRGGAAVVPPTLSTMVSRRLERLEPSERTVLLAAAVVGDFDTALLGSVAQQSDAVVHDALAHAVDHGLVETIGGRLEFRHATMRDAVLDLALPHVVQALHARAAEALARHDDEHARNLERRATHLRAIGRDDDAAALLVTASGRSLHDHALLEGERLARAALALAERPELHADAGDALGAALATQGRWHEALAVDQATVAEHGQTPDRWLRMAQCALDVRLLKVAHSLTEDALATDADNAFVEVMAGRLALAGGDAERALTCAARALAHDTNDPRAVCGALDLEARALDYTGRRSEAAETYNKVIETAAASGLVQEQLRALLSLSEFELLDGREPVRMFEACEVAREHGALVEQAWGELNLAIALILQGDPAAGHRLASEAVERARLMRLDLLPFLLAARAGAESFLGYDSYDATLAEARELAGDVADFDVHAGGIAGDHYVRAGRYDDAIREMQRGIDATRANPGGVPSDSPYWIVLAYEAAGRADDARRALREALETPGEDRFHSRRVVRDAAEALLARDARGIDDTIAAAPGRMPLELATIRVIAAEVIGGDDRPRWLREALDAYEAAGCITTADRVRRLLRDAGGTVPRRRSGGKVAPQLIPLGVTAREAEILGLVAEGASNAAIAERLFISVRTVESHISSLLAKLQVTSRQELATVYTGTP